MATGIRNLLSFAGLGAALAGFALAGCGSEDDGVGGDCRLATPTACNCPDGTTGSTGCAGDGVTLACLCGSGSNPTGVVPGGGAVPMAPGVMDTTQPVNSNGVTQPAANGSTTPPPQPAANNGANNPAPTPAPVAAVPSPSGEQLPGSCPGGFTPYSGLNAGFTSSGIARDFSLILPADTSTPRPLFIPLANTGQSGLAFTDLSGLDHLSEKGWIVAVPWRLCETQGRECNPLNGQPGTNDGRTWEPWHDGTGRPTDNEGPDAVFFREMVQCIAAHHAVDRKGIYLGGYSAGGQMTARALSFNADFYAGGVVGSINFGAGNVPASARTLDNTVAIIVWGGDTDIWPTEGPTQYTFEDGSRGASRYFNDQPNVVTVSCWGPHGHSWPANYTIDPPVSAYSITYGMEFTTWITDLLLSHPKGTPPSSFVLTPPPAPLECRLGTLP